MRGVMAFMVWLFSFWTWFKAFFSVRWSQTPPLDQASLATSLGVEQLRSDEGHHESELTAFLASLAEDTVKILYYFPGDDGFGLSFYGADGSKKELSGGEPTHREFLAAVASSKVASCERIFIGDYPTRCNLKQLEEMVRALVPNSNFKGVSLGIYDCSKLQMAECVSNLLSGNKAIEQLDLSSDSDEVVGKEAAELLANGLRENRVLKRLDLRGFQGLLDDEAMEVLTISLKENDSDLQELRVRKITDVGLEHLGVMLGTNTSLKRLEYWDPDKADDSTRSDEVYMRGHTSLSEALCVNRSLESLGCTVSSSMELKLLLQPLMPTNNKPQANTTLTELWLLDSRIGGKEGVDILVDMIRTNTSLLQLSLFQMRELCDYSDPDAVENVVAILEALKTNKSLKYVDFRGCYDVGGYKVLGTMMDMLLENRQLEQIDLNITRLEVSGDARYVHSELEKRRKLKLWDLIKGMANVSPKSGRVFLCGNPCAGKTTLRKSMKLVDEFDNKQSSQPSLRKGVINKFKDKRKTKKEPKIFIPRRVLERTRGIEVDYVECDGISISIWDMAGQTEYHSFHDLVIPNLSADGNCTLFLVTCNPLDKDSFQKRDISDMKKEVKYWLRFIASNTRRSWSYRPHVSIVMTHFDHWNTQADFASRIEDVVVELKLEFQEVLDFDPEREIFKVNGEDIIHARGVFDFIKVHMKLLLARLPKTIKACSEVQRLLVEWNKDLLKDPKTSKLPILMWDEFSEKICKQVEELQDVDKELAQRKQEFVAISLNDGGHIMYHEEGKFVITNPHWFCHDIMGEFLNRCANVDPKLEIFSHGMISIEHLKRILLDFIGGQGHEDLLKAIVGMMIKLHMCYKQDDKKIMIPSTLQGKSERLNWLTAQEAAKLNYVGRRFSCKDVKRTMLSLGFFPRLQVSFFKKLQKESAGNSYEIYEDVIKFICNGIEVIIEKDHVDVDILLRSKESQEKMLEYLENGIMRHIQDLLMNPTLGCPGVILIEHILRPECVRKLIAVEYRKDQIVSIADLELEVVKSGFNATHVWKACKGLQTGYDKVKDLLGSNAWEKLLKRLHVEPERHQRQMSHAFDQNDFLQRQEDILERQSNLLHEVSTRIEDALELSVKMQQSQVPKLPYLSKVGKKKLLTRFVPGLKEFELHLRCESRDGFHEVVDQRGCKVHFGSNTTRTVVTMLVWGLKTATIVTKIGAHVAGGMGEMVPDLGKAAGLILDTSGVLDQTSALCLNSLPDDVKLSPNITKDDRTKAEEWLIEVLEPKCKEKSTFYKMFGLKKVVYKAQGSGKHSIAWLCDDCERKGIQSESLVM